MSFLKGETYSVLQTEAETKSSIEAVFLVIWRNRAGVMKQIFLAAQASMYQPLKAYQAYKSTIL